MNSDSEVSSFAGYNSVAGRGGGNSDPETEPEAERFESAESEMLSSLSLDETCIAGAARHRSSNGSLPADFVSGGGNWNEIDEEGEDRVGQIGYSNELIDSGDKEGEPPGSPSSSGYAGERGTSVGSSGIEEDGDSVPALRDWDSENKGLGEDEASDMWRKKKKHFFILSHSGKPIYTRYGDEHKLAGFSATLQAIISFVENSGDHLKLVRAGKHQIIFLTKGPIYLVCISCTEEPYEALKGQLEFMYGQMLLILTKSINRCFEKNPKFDMSPLLGGTDVVFSSLIHTFSWNPATYLHAYTCLPLTQATRQAASAILRDVCDSGILFALLMCKEKVISLVGAQKASLHPDDILLLANFILASESFRTSESFSPICLPRYNPMAFLHAYVHFLDADTYLTLLSARPDAFYHLKDCRLQIQNVLLRSNVLSEGQRSVLEGGLRVEALPASVVLAQTGSPPSPQSPPPQGLGGLGGLWHFIYKNINLNQYVSSEFSSPITNPKLQKRLYRAYQKLYISMHNCSAGPHRMQFKRDEDYVMFCWITQDFELYAAFDPLADKAFAIKVCNRVCQWIRELEAVIFLGGDSTLSW